jgi:acyl-coenzyme A synthetase/AMP-(fatty) acid ligase
LPRFDLNNFLHCVQGFTITDVAIVPPIVATLLKLSPADAGLKSLRYVLCAGAPIPAQLQSKLYHFLHPKATVGQVWGATELGWITMFSPGERDDSGSVGKLLNGVSLKLVDHDGHRINDENIPGEALVRGPSVFQDYVGNSSATLSAFDSQGFYHTGDRVFIKDNKVFIDGRLKDTIKVNGWQVSPSEIETVLLQHPHILDVAVTGLSTTDSNGLEAIRPRAYVVASENSSVTSKDIIDFVSERLISYKRLTGGVKFVDGIPRNPTGKIIRRLLND